MYSSRAFWIAYSSDDAGGGSTTDTTTSETTTTVTPGTADAAAKSSTQDTGSKTPPEKRPLEEFPEDIRDYVKKLRVENETRRKAEDAAARAQKEADDKATAERGDWQKLATEKERRVTQLEAELKQRDHDGLKAKVAGKFKLPEALAARLHGDTEDELEADAKELAKLVAPVKPSSTDAGRKDKPGGGDISSTKSTDKKTFGFQADNSVPWR